MTESLFDTSFATEEAKKSTATDESKHQSSVSTESATPEAGPSTSASASVQTSAAAPVSEVSVPVAASLASSTTASYSENESIALPSLEDNTNALALINYRVLVSAKEAGCLIGQNGNVINTIREVTNTKAGISKLQNGSHERILTVSGTLDECSKALSYFAQALCNSSSENLTAYNFFPLRQLSSIPCIEGKTTVLRLLIPNLQMGTLIGTKGLRIQQLQSNFDISIIASKLFLPNSNERLVELQGSVDNLHDSLRIISRCLIEDFSSIVGTKYYIPKNGKKNEGPLNPSSNSNIHNSSSLSSSNKATNFNNNTNNHHRNKSHVSIDLPFSNEIVGALIGKNGSRIQGVRKVTGATIAISEEIEGQNERVFTVTGTSHAVDKAKDLLYHNLEREQKRAEINSNEST